MKVLDPGHRYELQVLDGQPRGLIGIGLQFVKREGPKFPGNVGHYPGTTSQEPLRALIHRAIYVNSQEWSWQTWLSIPIMKFLVWLYEWRAARRHHRKIPSIQAAVYGVTCEECGHVGCEGKHHVRQT